MDVGTPGIVVGYDGSPDADTAAAWAAWTAVLRDETVTALVVMDPADMPHSHPWPEPWWREIEDRGRSALQRAGATDVRVERRAGPTTATLVDRARDASMLVLGSKGHGRVAEILLGSVSHRAARRAQCPVVVVRPAMDPSSHRVVVGVDGSEPSLRALDFACRPLRDDTRVLRGFRDAAVAVERDGGVLAQGPAHERLALDARGHFLDVPGHVADLDAELARLRGDVSHRRFSRGRRRRKVRRVLPAAKAKQSHAGLLRLPVRAPVVCGYSCR